MSSVHSVDKLRSAEDEDAFLYGDEKPREMREGRDPRKRKRQSSEAGNFDNAMEKEEKGKETWYKEEYADRRKKDYEKENREEKRSRSRERRRRSRSNSPEYREDDRRGRRREDPDDWKRKSDAFLQSLNVPQQQEARSGSERPRPSLDRNKIQTMMGNTGTSQTQPTQMGLSGGGGYANYAYPPPQMNQYGGGYTAPAPVPQYVTPASAMGQPGYAASHSQSADRRRPEQERDREERRDWSEDKGREEKKRNDSRKDSDDTSEDDREKKQKSNVPLSVEQRDKLIKQKEQYEKAAEKLEDQLLKLKEQREALKQQGQKHEDNIMKENAKLQKEVKYRIQYMKDYMDKIDKGLEEDLKKQAETNRHAKEVEPERQPREFERELVERREERPSRGGSIERSREREGKVTDSRNRERSLSRERENTIRESKSRDKREESKEARREKTVRSREDSLSGSEKKSKKKKKKKAKERSSSSSETDQEHVKKKKKKRKAKSSGTESGSDSEGGKKGKGKKDKKGVIHMDEDVFRMVADLKGSKKRTGGHSEDMLMDLLGKMSEAYMKTKQENTELASRCKILENQNGDLRKKLEESKAEQSRPREDQPRAREEQPRIRMREEQTRLKEERGGFGEETRVVRALEEIREVKIKQEKMVKEIVAPMPTAKMSKNANLEPLGARKMGRSKWDQGPNEVTLDPALAMAVPPPSSMEYRPESPSRDEDHTKSVRSRMMEKEIKDDDKEIKDDRDDKYGRDREDERHHKRDKRDRSKDRYRDIRDRSRSGDKRRDRSRSGDRRRDRSRSRDRRRDRSREEKDRRRGRDTVSGERSSVSKMRDKNDKIDLEEWVKPPENEGNKDPTLLSLKEKIKEKEAIAQEREDRRNRWVTTEPPAPVAPPQPIQQKPTEQPIPENRPQVAMQWGQTIKKMPDQQMAAKKAVPVVGKMPWLKRGGSAEYGGAGSSAPTTTATRVSKFGPPVSGVNMAVPPPTLVTLAPTLATSSQPAPPGAMVAPPGMAIPPPGFSAPPLPPVPAPPPKPRIDRNPKPQSMDMNAMLAAAHRHMQSRFGGVPPPPVPEPELSIPLPCDMPGMPPPRQQRQGSMEMDYDTGPDVPALPAPDTHPAPNNQPAPDVPGEISIPLPPLPAAHDKDRLAHVDTRPPRIPTPEPTREKTELDEMLEKHSGSGAANLPPGFAGPDKADLVTGHVWQASGGVYDYADIPEPDNRPVEHNGSPMDDGGPDAEELRMMGIDPEDAVLS